MKPPRRRSQWSDLATHLGLEGMNDEALAEAARQSLEPEAPAPSAAPSPSDIETEGLDVRGSGEVVRDVQSASNGPEPELVLPEPPKSSRWSSLASALGLRWRDSSPAPGPTSAPVPAQREPEPKRPEARRESAPREEAPRRPEPKAVESAKAIEPPKAAPPVEEEVIGWSRPARPARSTEEREARPREERGDGRRGAPARSEERPTREERPAREERPRREERRPQAEAQAGELPPRGEPAGGFGSGLLDFEDAPPATRAERETTGRHAFRPGDGADSEEFADRSPAADRGAEGDRPRRRRRRRGGGGDASDSDAPAPARAPRVEPAFRSEALDDEPESFEEEEIVELDAEGESEETGEVSETRRRRRRRRRGGSSAREGSDSPARPAAPAPASDRSAPASGRSAPVSRRDLDDEDLDDEEDDVVAKSEDSGEEESPSDRPRRGRRRRGRSSSDRPGSDRPASDRSPSDRPASDRPTSDRTSSERRAGEASPAARPAASEEGAARPARPRRGEGRSTEPRRAESRDRERPAPRDRELDDDDLEPVEATSDGDEDMVESTGVDPRFAKIPTWQYCVTSVIDGNLGRRTNSEPDRPRRGRRPPRRPTT